MIDFDIGTAQGRLAIVTVTLIPAAIQDISLANVSAILREVAILSAGFTLDLARARIAAMSVDFAEDTEQVAPLGPIGGPPLT